ncbi:hypothetical protein CSUI_003529, partial [Cystoisospora suis]
LEREEKEEQEEKEEDLSFFSSSFFSTSPSVVSRGHLPSSDLLILLNPSCEREDEISFLSLSLPFPSFSPSFRRGEEEGESEGILTKGRRAPGVYMIFIGEQEEERSILGSRVVSLSPCWVLCKKEEEEVSFFFFSVKSETGEISFSFPVTGVDEGEEDKEEGDEEKEIVC